MDKKQKLIIIAFAMALAGIYFVKTGVYELQSNGADVYRLNKFTGKVYMIKHQVMEEVFEKS